MKNLTAYEQATIQGWLPQVLPSFTGTNKQQTMRITQIAYERTIKTADGGTATYSAIATVGADSPRHSECFQLLKQTVDSYVQSIIDMQNKQISLDKKGD